MRENKFRKWIKKEIETEALTLEQQAEENEELTSLKMTEDSYADLMKRIEAVKTPEPKAFHIRKRTLLAVALAAILLAAVGAGASGARLFAPKIEESSVPGEFNVQVISGDEIYYFEMTEDEAYEEIEEQLGIQALRLGYKPQGMELKEVFIGKDTSEASMEFVLDEQFFRIYENKQSDSAAFNTNVDGQIIETVENFYYDLQMNIVRLDEENRIIMYAVQLEYRNAYYYITSNFDLDEIKEIIYGIIFESL